MAAPLALTRKTGGRDLLDVAPTEGPHRQDADDSQDDANPPVPNVCCEHVLMVATERGERPVTRRPRLPRSHQGRSNSVVVVAVRRGVVLLVHDVEYAP